MLRLLLRTLLLMVPLQLLIVTLVYSIGERWPSAGVLQLTGDTRTLFDLGQGITLILPQDRSIIFAPDRTRFIRVVSEQTPEPHTHYYLGTIHDETSEYLYGGRTETVLVAPRWSPDGTALAFVRRPVLGDPEQLFVLRLADGQLTRLADEIVVVSAPVWAPDASYLLMAAQRNNQYDLMQVDTETGNITWLTHTPANETTPIITPDGKSVIFVSNENGTPDIYAIAADGAQRRPLIASPRVTIPQAVTPDGRWLAFTEIGDDRRYSVHRYDLATGYRELIIPDISVLDVAWW